MSTPTPPLTKRNRPIIGMLAGFQVYGTGMIYGFIDSLVRGIQAATRDRDCGLLLACGMNRLDPQTIRPAWPSVSGESDFIPIGPWNTDGLIVVPPLGSDERSKYIRELNESGFPIVFVGTAEGEPVIDVDNEGGIRQALQHLVGHSHRRIAFIAGNPEDDNGDSGSRLRAFKAAAQEYGLDTDPRLIVYGYHHINEGRQAMSQLLATKIPFTAVLSSNDESALGAIQVLAEAGIRVPQDIAVIGFDDRPEGLNRLPPLTTVHHPIFERGYHSARLLIDRIENRSRADAQRIIRVPTRLIVRRSCGCSPEEALSEFTARVTAAGEQASPSLETLQARLTRAMAIAILVESRHLNSGEIYELARSLVDAFTLSLERADPENFYIVTQAVLRRVEQAHGDAHAWELAMRALESAPERLALAEHVTSLAQAVALMEKMFAQARTLVDESVRRQYWLDRNSVSEAVGFLTARLLAALNDNDILTILAENLPNVGIRRAAVVLFEPEGDDPVAWSVMRTSMDPRGQPVRFRSRDFPAQHLFPLEDSAFSVALIPLSHQQGIPGYMVFDIDNLELCAVITHAVNTALKAARMYHEAIDGRRLAEEANNQKNRFLSTVGHELRTPLSLILATSELLLEDKKSGSQDKAYLQNLAGIRASAQHLDGLIRDVLDLTRNELGQLKLACEPIDLATALEPIAIVGQQLARVKGLKWRATIPRQLPKIWADRARLRQVTLNLITNAVKFTSQGEVTLGVERGNRSITITVRDTGLGIPPDESEIIFDDFHQSKRTVTRDYGGLGLGLAICKRLVEMHAGEIGVHSTGEEGAGSTFFVTLPILEIGLDAIEKSVPRNQRILILDDDIGDAEKLHLHLTQRGFTVQRIRPENIALSLEALSVNPPGTVLIDAGRSYGQSWESIKLLKKNPATRRTAISFYSLKQEYNTGAVRILDYLTKPVGTSELAQALQQQGLTNEREARTLLVVDDDPGLLEMHARIVQTLSADYRVLKARNGKEALVLIQQEHPDLVLLDLIMPEMDGFEVLEAMQKLETTRDIPVIVLTGQTLAEEEMARLHRSVAAVLGKGVFTVEETLTHVKQTLNHSQKQGAEAQRLVRKAMAYLHKHYAKPLTREKVARYVGVSEDYLTRCFQQELRMPPMTYLTRYRINQAKTLLAQGEMNVTVVAATVGFSSEFYFSRVFRREVGVTPSSYRRGQRSA